MYLILLGIFVIIIAIKLTQKKDAKQIPEPKKLPLFGNMATLFSFSDNPWNVVQKLNKEYPVYRVSRLFSSWISFNDADDIQIFMSGKQHIEKAQMYDFLRAWLGSGLLTSTGQKWHQRRKLLTPTFHFNILKEFFEVFQKHSEVLVNALSEECGKPYTDVSPIISHFTLHIICETAMGLQLDKLKQYEKEYEEAMKRIGLILTRRIMRPWLEPDFIYRLSSSRQEELAALKPLHDFTVSIVEEQKRAFENSHLKHSEEDENLGFKKRLALLNLLLTLRQQGHDITDEGIREEVDTFTFEGHDTISVAVSFGLMLIANHPDVQTKIFNEVQEVTNNGQKVLQIEDISQLVYLEMVIKEILRFYPSVPKVGRKTDTDVYTSTGYFIPKGSQVTLHIYSIHHNEKYFPNPEVFDPERFLPENSKGRHPYSYIPFSAGLRNCIGQRFAMIELKVMLASIIQNFKLIPIDTPSSIVMVSNLTLKSKNGVKVKFEKRN